jgi:hypothetical protein
VGAQKAGTTALYAYLAGHPSIAAPGRKEIGFFTPEVLLDLPAHNSHPILCGDGDVHRPLASRRKRAWYHAHFPLPHRLAGRLAFEATPEYLHFPEAASRIHAYDPGMKLIILLREPAERAYSAWNMYRKFGATPGGVYAPHHETRSFEQAVREEIGEIAGKCAKPLPGYVQRGLYAEQIERYLELFPREQLFVLDSAALASDTTATVNRVLAFVGLAAFPDDSDWPPEHVGDYGREAPNAPPVLELLREFYVPHNERLRGLLDEPPAWLLA